MMKDTRCQTFDTSCKHISRYSEGPASAVASASCLSLSFFSETTLPYLPVSTCAIADCRWWTSLGQGPPPKTCSNNAGYRRRSPLRFVLPRSTWSTDNAILGVNWRSREAVQARVRLSSMALSLDTEWTERYGPRPRYVLIARIALNTGLSGYSLWVQSFRHTRHLAPNSRHKEIM